MAQAINRIKASTCADPNLRQENAMNHSFLFLFVILVSRWILRNECLDWSSKSDPVLELSRASTFATPVMWKWNPFLSRNDNLTKHAITTNVSWQAVALSPSPLRTLLFSSDFPLIIFGTQYACRQAHRELTLTVSILHIFHNTEYM